VKTLASFLIAATLAGCANTEFIPYAGAQQTWPTAPGSFVDTKLAVPVYYGLPPRPYRVLGEVTTEQGHTWLWTNVQSEAMEKAAKEAKTRGADAIIVMRRDASVSGYTSTSTTTVVGNAAVGSGVITPVQTGHARVTAIKFL